MYVCNVCMYVCICVCMHVCLYVRVCTTVTSFLNRSFACAHASRISVSSDRAVMGRVICERTCGMVGWYGMVWYGMVWYGMVWYSMIWYGMVWYGIVWYDMVWYGMVWYVDTAKKHCQRVSKRVRISRALVCV